MPGIVFNIGNLGRTKQLVKSQDTHILVGRED